MVLYIMRVNHIFVSAFLGLGLFACATQSLQNPEQGQSRDAGELSQGISNPGKTVADYLTCLREQNILIISAHRGGPSTGYPENALETFNQTLSQSPMVIETDIRMTADNVLVLLHDEDLSRTTTGDGLVSEVSYSELRKLQLKDNDDTVTDYFVPTLAEALEWARGRTILQLDVKPGAPIELVARMVAGANAQSYAAIIAYTVDDALKAARVDPDITVSIEIMDLERLDEIAKQGLSTDRVMAWTGIETERPELWRELNHRGVSAAWGSLWYLDREIEASGDFTSFARLADEGLDVLSTDLHLSAFKGVETRQNTAAAITKCNG